jgi:periplasmic protein TonB
VTAPLAVNSIAWQWQPLKPAAERRSLFAPIAALHVLLFWAMSQLAQSYPMALPPKAIALQIVTPQPLPPTPLELPQPKPVKKTPAQPPATTPPPPAWVPPPLTLQAAPAAPAVLQAVDQNPVPPAPLAVISAAAPAAAAPSPATVPTPVPAPVPAPVPVVLPRSDADYLNNPAPNYPAASRRQGETGRVIVRCFVTADGKVDTLELRTSSGFERLDAAALQAVKSWRFKPGSKGGAPEAMWVNVPVVFSLD